MYVDFASAIGVATKVEEEGPFHCDRSYLRCDAQSALALELLIRATTVNKANPDSAPCFSIGSKYANPL